MYLLQETLAHLNYFKKLWKKNENLWITNNSTAHLVNFSPIKLNIHPMQNLIRSWCLVNSSVFSFGLFFFRRLQVSFVLILKLVSKKILIRHHKWEEWDIEYSSCCLSCCQNYIFAWENWKLKLRYVLYLKYIHCVYRDASDFAIVTVLSREKDRFNHTKWHIYLGLLIMPFEITAKLKRNFLMHLKIF